MAHPPDAVLVRRTLAGDDSAFADLLQRHGDRVHAIAYSYLLDIGAAEDVAQDTFLKAWRGLTGLRTPDSFGAWLGRVAAHTALSARRKMHGDLADSIDPVELADVTVGDAPEQDRVVRDRDMVGLVGDALASLPDTLRAPVVMRCMHDTPYRAMSESLAVPVRTLEKRIPTALRRLREYFDANGLTDDVQDVLRAHGLAAVAAADLANTVMSSVRGTTPGSQAARAKPLDWSMYVGAASAAVCGVLLAAYGSQWSSALAEAGAVGGQDTVTRVSVHAAGPAELRSAATSGTLIALGSGAEGWSPADPTRDGSRPMVQTRHMKTGSHGLMTINTGDVHRQFDPVHGTVALSLWVFASGHADLDIGLEVDGQLRPFGHALGVSVHRSTDWSYHLFDPTTTDGQPPTGSTKQGRVALAPAESRGYDIGLVHRTFDGTYDVYIDGQLMAEAISRPWTEGRPITGVAIGAGEPESTAGQAVYFDDLTVFAQESTRPERPSSRWVAPSHWIPWQDRPLIDLLNDVGRSLELGHYDGAQDILDVAAARFPRDARVHHAMERMRDARRWLRETEDIARAEASALADGVRHLAQMARPAATSKDEYVSWVRRHVGVESAWWDEGHEENHGGLHLRVRLWSAHYRSNEHLFAVGVDLARAYHLMNARGRRAFGVELHRPSGGAGVAVSVNSWDLGDAFHERYSPWGVAPEVAYPVRSIVATPTGRIYANRGDGLLLSHDVGVSWARADGEYNRLEVLFALGATVYARLPWQPAGLMMMDGAGPWRLSRASAHPLVGAATDGQAVYGFDAAGGLFRREGSDGQWEMFAWPRRERRPLGFARLGGRLYARLEGSYPRGVTMQVDARHAIREWAVASVRDTGAQSSAGSARAAGTYGSDVQADWLRERLGVHEGALSDAGRDLPSALAWRVAEASEDGTIDLEALIDPEEDNSRATAYLVLYLTSPDARRVWLNVGQDDTLAIWVNGRRVSNGGHPRGTNDDTYSIPLRPGANGLMLKVHEYEGVWFVRAAGVGIGWDDITVTTTRGQPGVPVTGDRYPHWTLVNNGLANGAVQALVPWKGRLYAATGDGPFRFDPNSLQWTRLVAGFPPRWSKATEALVVFEGRLYAGSIQGLHRLDEETDVWQNVGEGFGEPWITALAHTQGVLFAGTKRGAIYRATDGGETWELVYGRTPPPPIVPHSDDGPSLAPVP